ncbi:hypothetical protein [Corallococcus silvisoli]|uniref:hypothetical protein n=1 Tax=Corallococcus silvisoli TaxID=2697031 RepID=UPI0013766DA2|nr:hypothetical protein [Corallococcus silvisoli]NBD13756.1 hypothetical protein [Corallococcus silvisoli]
MPPRRPYEEDAELTRYVLRYYQHLATDVERKAYRASSIPHWDVVPAEGPLAHPLVRKWYGLDDPAVLAALEEGREALLRRMRDRVLKEHADVVFIHRCPRCERIVETPRSRQCLWCGHDWHARPG